MNYKKTIETMLYTRLLTINNPYFDFNKSNFSVFNNTSIERGDSNSKTGCGRVALH